MTLEKTILANLIFDETYCRRVIPYLKADYFGDEGEKKVFTLIDFYLTKYNKIPTLPTLLIDLQNEVGAINEHCYTAASTVIESLERKEVDPQWLLDHTEKFCQEKAIYQGIMTSIDIMDDKTGKKSRGAIPKILQDALAVSFDTHIGLDVFEDADQWFEDYHRVDNHIPFDIDKLNEITKGGVIKKTLNVFLAGTNVGKTLAMSHMAATNLVMGYNVLYITMEMSEKKITERIYANLLDESLDVLSALPKVSFDKKIERLHKLTKSRLIVKEFPTACAGVNHFRHLLNELKLKKNFIPDIIYVDYINICMSSRLKLGSSINSYLYVKAVAEELRGFAVENNVPVITATQTNREGSVDSDFDMTATSDSFGLPMTADLLVGIISTEELEGLNQYMFKTLKNRYNDATKNRRFVVGVDRSKMRLYNVEASAQNLMKDDVPVMDKGSGFNLEAFKDFK
jgi:hypothetical protein